MRFRPPSTRENAGSGHRLPTGHRPRKETREAGEAVRKWGRAPPTCPPARPPSATEGNVRNGSSRSEVGAGTAHLPAGRRPRKETREAEAVVRRWKRAPPACPPSATEGNVGSGSSRSEVGAGTARRRPPARPPSIGHGRKRGKRKRLFGSGSGHRPPLPARRHRASATEGNAGSGRDCSEVEAGTARPPLPAVGHGRKRRKRKQPFGSESGHCPPAAARRASATEGNAGSGSSRSEVRAGTARPPAGHRPRKETREAGEVVRKWERAPPAARRASATEGTREAGEVVRKWERALPATARSRNGNEFLYRCCPRGPHPV